MKKTDIVLSLITGEGVALLFNWFLKKSGIEGGILYWVMPVLFPFITLFCLWVAYVIGKKSIVIFQLAKFLLIGAFFALIDLLALNFLMVYFNATQGNPYLLFVTVSFIIATSLKYVADKYWAFEKMESKKMGSEFGVFFIVTLISAGIQIGIAALVVNRIGVQFGMDPLLWANIGKICGIVTAAAWNFVGYKYIVFKK